MDEAVREQATAAVRAGLPWIHLRDHEAEPGDFEDAARTLVAQLRSLNEGVLISINTRLEVARRLKAHLHVGGRGPAPQTARRVLESGTVIGYSAHTDDTSAPSGADYLFYSPVFPTRSKPESAGVGVEALQRASQRFAGVPVFALGGITPERVAACLDAGAFGVAVLSGIFGTAHTARATQTYLEALDRAVSNCSTIEQQNAEVAGSP